MEPTEIKPEEYIAHLFKDIPTDKYDNVLKEAYKNALDTRKFEIDLYWKRATYFWAFIAAIFIATYSMLNSSDKSFITISDPDGILKKMIVILIALLGYVFSIGWYFVNRGSKVWQENWEMHISILENSINGPLFKTLATPNLYFWKLIDDYPFSVSKVNQILSLCVVIFWIILINSLIIFFCEICVENCCHILSVLLTSIILFIIGIIFHAQSTSFIYKHWQNGKDSSNTTYVFNNKKKNKI